MADMVTKKKLEDADIDVDNLGKAVNEETIVTPRYGDQYKSAPLAIKEIEDNGIAAVAALNAKADELVAQGFYKGYTTEALLLAAKPAVAEMRARADDTRKIYRWNRTSAEGVTPVTGNWVDTGLSDLDLAKADATAKDVVVETTVKSYVDAKVPTANSFNIHPLAVDSAGNIPIWLEDGQLSFAKMHKDSVFKIKKDLDAVYPIANSNITGAAYPVVSDGTSLRRWKAKASKIKAGLSQQLNVVMTGDSWADQDRIPKALAKLLTDEYGRAGTGWIYLGVERTYMDGINTTTTGTWTRKTMQDADASTNTLGWSPDGMVAVGSTGATYLVVNLRYGDNFNIFYHKSSGSFSYSVNGGGGVTVTPDANGSDVQFTTVPVQTGDSVRITVISGNLILYGFHLRDSSTATGVELNKMGLGGARAVDYDLIAPTAQANFSEYLSPDVVIIILGTNDYRTGSSVASYISGISNMIDGYRASSPDCGFILLAPALSNEPVRIAQKEYRDAVYAIAKEKNVEFYNMYDDWGTFFNEQANGMWRDAIHVSEAGAYRVASALFNKLLEV